KGIVRPADPVAGLAENFSPIPRTAPPPLGTVTAGGSARAGSCGPCGEPACGPATAGAARPPASITCPPDPSDDAPLSRWRADPEGNRDRRLGGRPADGQAGGCGSAVA